MNPNKPPVGSRVRTTALLVFVCIFALIACGTSLKNRTQYAAESPATESPAPEPGPAPEYSSRTGRAPAPNSAPSSSRAYDRAQERGPQDAHGAHQARLRGSASGAAKAEQESSTRDDYQSPESWRRPGLATRWGEERDSRLHEVTFYRQHSQPGAVVSLHYDDEDGIGAMTGLNKSYAYEGVFPLFGGALLVSVVDSGDDPLPTVSNNGRHYVFGDSGDRYQLRIQNNTPGRFEVVASVDGLDVIDGQDGHYGKRGYLVNPWDTLTIEGFRDSRDTVRAFRFGAVEDSYAAQRGKGMNIGVIGIALFEEAGFQWQPPPQRYPAWDEQRRNADPFPGRFAPPPGY